MIPGQWVWIGAFELMARSQAARLEDVDNLPPGISSSDPVRCLIVVASSAMQATQPSLLQSFHTSRISLDRAVRHM